MTETEKIHRSRLIADAKERLVPQHNIEGIVNYIVEGIEPGGFLRAVFENNLMESLGRADVENRFALFNICAFIYNDTPADCHGSPEKVKAWLERGGLLR